MCEQFDSSLGVGIHLAAQTKPVIMPDFSSLRSAKVLLSHLILAQQDAEIDAVSKV